MRVDRWGRHGSGKVPVPTRRTFIKSLALGVGAIAAGPDLPANAADNSRLIDRVVAVCGRLGPLGCRKLLLDATGGQLDIGAADLRRELAKPLARIDRTYPGFGDFDIAATRAIDPGRPDRSLIYHALASPTVVADGNGVELRGFPTIAEIEAVENYVYGSEPPTIEELRRRAAGRKLGIAVFALHYLNAPMSVHGRCAELCFSRSGIARLGRSSRFTTRAPATSPASMKRGRSTSASCRAASRPISRCR